VNLQEKNGHLRSTAAIVILGSKENSELLALEEKGGVPTWRQSCRSN